MTTTLRLGILGVAHGHVHSYIAACRTLPGIEIVGLYDRDLQVGQAVSERHTIPLLPDVQSLLDHHLDGVIVCSENTHHARLVLQAAGQTPYILCEKPIATSEADAIAMIQRCRDTRTHLQIAFPVRFMPPIQHLKAQLDAHELGEIYAVKCTNHGGNPSGWFKDPALSGGGAVMDHTVHMIDIVRWLWQTEVAEVYAEVGVGLLHPDLPIDDVGLLSFRLSNGVYGTLDTSWSRPTAYPAGYDVKIEVVGQRGTITVDALRQHLHVSSTHWGKSRHVAWGSDMDLGLIADFVDCIRTRRTPNITGEDGLAALQVALAAYASAQSGAPIHLSPPSSVR